MARAGPKSSKAGHPKLAVIRRILNGIVSASFAAPAAYTIIELLTICGVQNFRVGHGLTTLVSAAGAGAPVAFVAALIFALPAVLVAERFGVSSVGIFAGAGALTGLGFITALWSSNQDFLPLNSPFAHMICKGLATPPGRSPDDSFPAFEALKMMGAGMVGGLVYWYKRQKA